MTFKTLAASAAILALSAAQAAAGQCGYQYCWGAVGIGQYGVSLGNFLKVLGCLVIARILIWVPL